MAYGWEGEHVRLVPLEVDRHLGNALRWLNDPEVTAWLEHGDLPLMRLAEQEFFDRMARSETDVAFAIETLAGEHIGFTGMHRISFRHGVAYTGIFIGSREHWRRGLGGEAVRLRARYAFEVLNLRMLLSEVMAGNDASLRLLAAAGYHEVGRIPRRYFKRGAWRDLVMLALERPAG